MRFTRTSLALGVLIAGTLFVAWPAASQSPFTQAQPNLDLAANVFQPGHGWNPRDPELAKLINAEVTAEREVNQLKGEYAKTEGNEARTKVKDKLNAALSKQFDAQQKRRELELDRVEKQVKKLRDLMKRRDEERKKIIENRLDQLVREADGLGWAPPVVRQPGNGNYNLLPTTSAPLAP
jgi:hypothetical protein